MRPRAAPAVESPPRTTRAPHAPPPPTPLSISAQDTLLGALREEVARLNARLSAEGGPARVPPAVVAASSLFAAAQAEAAAARARAAEHEAEASRLQAALAAAAEQLRLFGALTALELVASRAGAHSLATVDPATGARVAFQLEFFTDGDSGARMVEFLPGENAQLLPPFMAVRVRAPPARPRSGAARPLTPLPPAHTHTRARARSRPPPPRRRPLSSRWTSAPCFSQR